jgi:two-component system, cell cycle sensor histidine kinase and response regulator CckA
MVDPQRVMGMVIRILHLEDNLADAQLCLYRLRTDGLNVQVDVARNSKEFKEKAAAGNYDVILGDYRLPDWSGLDAVNWLRSGGIETPFILVTGTLGDDLAVECIKRGATDYVLKDRLDRLGFAIYRALQERGTRAERDRAQRELLERNEEYRSIIQGAPYGIYRADHDGNLLMANPALVTMLGYGSETEVLKLKTTRDIFVNPVQRELALSQVSSGVTPSEHHWRRKDGKQITVRLAGRRLPGKAGGAVNYEVFVEDITAQRTLEQEFLQAQKMEAIGRLAGGVAHDFNNLLMIINSCLELWQHEKTDAAKREKYVQQIRDAASMAAFVVRQLLTFSRKQVVERQIVDLNSILKDLSKMLPRLLGADIEVIIIPGRNLERVEVDRGHVEQVVMNLAVNARDAMPNGGKLVIETTNIELEEKEAGRMKLDPGRYVCMAVTDTGTGMDAETQARIFEPFFTTKERGKGTGLGLATVSAIVKENGGRVEVDSTPGKGSNFEVYFPAAAAAGQTPAAAKTVAAAAERGTETILVVEDEGALRAITCEYLQSQGYTVLAASNGMGALETCRNHAGAIQLLLTDVVMPGISGPEVAAAALSIRPELRVIYVSGYIDRQIDLDALGSGAVFLQKPYNLGDLARKIRDVLPAGNGRAA